MNKAGPTAGRARTVLAAMAVAFAAATIALHFTQGGTSTTVRKTVTAASGRGGPAPAATTVTTTVSSAASDTLELGLLGFAVLFAFVALFYPRISAITGPGGLGITLLSPEQEQEATAAVARRAADAAAAATPAPAPGQPAPTEDALRGKPPLVRLTSLATSQPPDWLSAQHVRDATQDSVGQTSRATARAISYGQTLLGLAKTSPDSLRALAQAWGIPPQEWSQLLTGTIAAQTWQRLADRALTEEGLPPPPA